MLIKKLFVTQLRQSVRFYSVSIKSKSETLLLQRTTYEKDDWTNITPRFSPFIGAQLFKKYNHPLRLTQEEVVKFFQKWYNDTIDSSQLLPFYDNLDPIEKNPSSVKHPNIFYVNEQLILRTHFRNRQIKLLQSGVDNFLAVIDLYRRCTMDANHFPAFHRIYFVRTHPNNAMKMQTIGQLKDEQQTILIELAKHLFGTNVKYRFTDANLLTNEPSWIFEMFHQNAWHRISGGGIIRDDIFDECKRTNTMGWEIAIGLDRLAMMMYNIFDIRLLWNGSKRFLAQFEPVKKRSTHLNLNTNNDQNAIRVEKNGLEETKSERPQMIQPLMDQTLHPRKKTHEMRMSFILSNGESLETFPTDDLCQFIKKHSEGAAVEVNFLENKKK